MKHGVSWVGPGDNQVRGELSFGTGAQVRDLTSVEDATQRSRAVVLVEDAQELSLVLVPEPPWNDAAELTFQTSAVQDAPGLAEVALE